MGKWPKNHQMGMARQRQTYAMMRAYDVLLIANQYIPLHLSLPRAI